MYSCNGKASMLCCAPALLLTCSSITLMGARSFVTDGYEKPSYKRRFSCVVELGGALSKKGGFFQGGTMSRFFIAVWALRRGRAKRAGKANWKPSVVLQKTCDIPWVVVASSELLRNSTSKTSTA